MSGGYFASIHTSNAINENAVNEKVFSAELGYGFRSQYFSTNLNLYRTNCRRIIKPGVRTKVLMLSATPVNNRFYDLRNQLALAYEGNPEEINEKLDTLFTETDRIVVDFLKDKSLAAFVQKFI